MSKELKAIHRIKHIGRQPWSECHKIFSDGLVESISEEEFEVLKNADVETFEAKVRNPPNYDFEGHTIRDALRWVEGEVKRDQNKNRRIL